MKDVYLVFLQNKRDGAERFHSLYSTPEKAREVKEKLEKEFYVKDWYNVLIATEFIDNEKI